MRPLYPTRGRQRFQMTALAAAAVVASGLAQAQPAPPAKPAAPEGEVVVITGFRAAIESALTTKRDDAGIVDAIRAEDIAKFPDTNQRRKVDELAAALPCPTISAAAPATNP